MADDVGRPLADEPDSGSEPGPEHRPTLAQTIDRLRDELDGLRHAMTTRAVIEQAKGMLMERYGESTDEAFHRLATLSQHANVKLVDVAAALVAAAAPPADPPGPALAASRLTLPPPPTARSAAVPPSVGVSGPSPTELARASRQRVASTWPRQGSDAPEFGLRVRAQGRWARTRNALLAARHPDDVLAAALMGLSEATPPRTAALALLGHDGTLRLVASLGVPGPVAARWQMVPLDLPLAVCGVVRSGRPLWLDHPGPQAPETALGLGLDEDWTTASLLPLTVDGRAVGVLAFAWQGRLAGSPAMQADQQRLAAGVAVSLERVGGGGLALAEQTLSGGSAGVRADALPAVWDVLFQPVVICRAVRDATDAVVDLVLVRANAAAADPLGRPLAGHVGRSLMEVWPDVLEGGLVDACVRVLESGMTTQVERQVWRLDRAGGPLEAHYDVRVTRYRDGLLVTWAPTGSLPGPAADEAPEVGS